MDAPKTTEKSDKKQCEQQQISPIDKKAKKLVQLDDQKNSDISGNSMEDEVISSNPSSADTAFQPNRPKKATSSLDLSSGSDYAEVMPDRFRKLLHKYDNIDYSADLYLRTHINSVLYGSASSDSSDAPDNSQGLEEITGEPHSIEMLHLLKRMMVKKKYEMYTIRQENLYKKNKLKRMSTQISTNNGSRDR